MTVTLASEPAPRHWNTPCTHNEPKLHQLSPYIGKLKSSIAGELVEAYSTTTDLILDPFCGSGTIPLEAAIRGRRVIASDTNSYATLLTSAKLAPPTSLQAAIDSFHRISSIAERRHAVDLRTVPLWVRRFFHPQTLKDAIAFADACIREHEWFLLACLLGILHHQRPGFLSYPSSHLVPYLRENKYPRRTYPEMYERREIEPRLLKKLTRVFKNDRAIARIASMPAGSLEVRRSSVEMLDLRSPVDAVITSPPYMNALDYRRDNRLRLWFLDRTVQNYTTEPTDRRSTFDTMVDGLRRKALSRLRLGGYCVLVVGETVRRKKMIGHPAERILCHLAEAMPGLRLRRVVEDEIPDVRRTRRGGRATKTELILVLQKCNQ